MTATQTTLGRLARVIHRPTHPPHPAYDKMPIEDLKAHISALRTELASTRTLRSLGATHPTLQRKVGRLVREIRPAEAAWLQRTSDQTALVAICATLAGRSL